jgi:hypothetical protein
MRTFCVLVAAVALSACGHAPPPKWNAASNQLCRGKLCYRVGELGTGWQEIHAEGASIAFFNSQLGAVVVANATCRDDAEAAPLSALTRQLLIGYTDREQVWQDRISIVGREALRTRVDARLDGVPTSLDLIVVRKDGCIYDLSYAAPPERYESGRAAFERFVHGFRDERRPT